MPNHPFDDALKARGEALRIGVTLALADFLGQPTLQVRFLDTAFVDPGLAPAGFVRHGLLIKHFAQGLPGITGPFLIGWFLDENGAKAGLERPPSEDGSARVEALVKDLSELLVNDRYEIIESNASASNQPLSDFLAGELPYAMAWMRFQVEGSDSSRHDLWLAWPESCLSALFGKSAAAEKIDRALNDAEARARESQQALRRVLRTPVPIIVTLASKDIATSKLLQLRPGSIIEFDRRCDQPLQLSVNNLPIGQGEAVKIGDHFGLRVIEVLSAEDRVLRLGARSDEPLVKDAGTRKKTSS